MLIRLIYILTQSQTWHALSVSGDFCRNVLKAERVYSPRFANIVSWTELYLIIRKKARLTSPLITRCPLVAHFSTTVHLCFCFAALLCLWLFCLSAPACFCELKVSTAMSVPSLLPADCTFSSLDHFSGELHFTLLTTVNLSSVVYYYTVYSLFCTAVVLVQHLYQQ